MKKVPYTAEYRKVWDDFCWDEPDAWFWHTTHWMEYCLHSRFNVQAYNESYLIFDQSGKQLLAIVPILIETSEASKEMTFSGGPTPHPIIKSSIINKKKLEDFIDQEYGNLAKHYDVKRLVVRQLNDYQNPGINSIQLLKHNFIDISSYTAVLPLGQSEKYLLDNMTKGHRSAIAKAIKKNESIYFYDENTITDSIWRRFQDAYFEAAGKKTRPDKSFEIFYQLICKGYAVLFESIQDLCSTSFVYVITYKHYAYYAMSCQLKHEHIQSDSQGIQWGVIQYLKDKGKKYYEFGEQYFHPTIAYPVDEKIINISKFKRGFGGDMILQPVGEKYYDDDYGYHVWQERCRKFFLGANV